jgi:hypothetical protein
MTVEEFYDVHGAVFENALDIYTEHAHKLTDEERGELHGTVIEKALTFYAKRMRATAQEARQDASQPAPETIPTPGTISVRPSPRAFTVMARMFTEAAQMADAALAAWKYETEGPDEDGTDDAETMHPMWAGKERTRP